MLRSALAAFPAALLLIAPAAAQFGAKRSDIETSFPKIAQGRVSLLGCGVPKENLALEACAFDAGEGVAVSFMFDAEKKTFKSVGIFFPEDKAQLGSEIAMLALKAARYTNAQKVDFSKIMQRATPTGFEAVLPGNVYLIARKLPPNLYTFGFLPNPK